MAQGGSTGDRWPCDPPGKRNTARRDSVTLPRERLPALRARCVVSRCGEETLSRRGLPDQVCGRFCLRIRISERCRSLLQSVRQTTGEVRIGVVRLKDKDHRIQSEGSKRKEPIRFPGLRISLGERPSRKRTPEEENLKE